MKDLIKIIAPLCLFIIATLFQNCSSTKTASSKQDTSEVQVSYETDIKPIMLAKCTPCHFPENGRKKMLDTYTATSTNIKTILHRVQLPVDDTQYMPFKSKREAVTSDEIELLETWMDQGMSK